jgi:hypothetical protein
VTLKGAGKRLDVSVEGSGDVNARDFPVEGGSFSIDGSGDVYTDLHGGESTVSIHGSGDFHYAGDARFVHMDMHGSGEVQRFERASSPAQEL